MEKHAFNHSTGLPMLHTDRTHIHAHRNTAGMDIDFRNTKLDLLLPFQNQKCSYAKIKLNIFGE